MCSSDLFFTAGNLLLGFLAIMETFRGSMDIAQQVPDAWRHFELAAIYIGISVFVDGLDGRIARMTNTVSDFGREMDSLADVISFGIAPGVLAFAWGVQFVDWSILPDATMRVQLLAYASGTPDQASKARRTSLSRALSVRTYLLAQGVQSTRIDVRALGNTTDEQPLPRPDPECRARGDRVDAEEVADRGPRREGPPGRQPEGGAGLGKIGRAHV